MPIKPTIVPFLWFDSNAEEAVNFYTSVFKNSSIGAISRYTEAGIEQHGRPAGSVMTIEFSLDGQKFTAINGGPTFKFTEAVSLMVMCETQNEIDHYWERLMEGGGSPLACGWLHDRFGLSWQVTPVQLMELIASPDKAQVSRVMTAMMEMVKIEIEPILRAAKG